jgi:DnaJ-class molecular chaperone
MSTEEKSDIPQKKEVEQVRCSCCFGTGKIYIFEEYNTCYRCDGECWYPKGFYIDLDD